MTRLSLWYALRPLMGAQPAPGPNNVVFGPFEFDDCSGRLTKYGLRVRLQGKPLQILSLLVDRSGEIVSREELQHHLWQGTTFVDFEQGLNSAVNRLRQALGDSADQPRYIETFPGRGYRFVAPIRRTPAGSLVEVPAPATPRMKPEPVKASSAPLAVGFALLILISVGYWMTGGRNATVRAPTPTRLDVVPPAGFALESAAGRQSFALSPDGTRIAFTAMDTSGDFSVFLRDFDSLEPRLLPNTEGAHGVFWAPDSRSLYVTVKGKLWRMPLAGDSRVLLADAPPFLMSGVWLDPARLLLNGFRATYFLSPAGGALQLLPELYLWPQRLPDGTHILTVQWSARAGRFQARVVRLRDFAAQDLLESDSRVQYMASTTSPGTGYLLYIRGGDLLAHPFDPRSLRLNGEAVPVAPKVYSFMQSGGADFSVSDTGTVAYQTYTSRSQLVWLDRAGRQVGTVGPANVNVKSARLSPDGRRIATPIYDIERGQQDLWLFDKNATVGRRLSSESGLRDAPIWSPDSTRLAFLRAAEAGPPRVHVRGLGQQDEETILAGGGDYSMPTDWSPDGRFVVFVNTAFGRIANEQQSDVSLVDLARGGKLIRLLASRFHESNPAFSPDGKWLAFTSDESGRSEVYLQAFRAGGTPAVTGERYLVSTGGAQAVRWRRDGKELFYLASDGKVHAVPVASSSKPKPTFGPATALFTIGTEARAAIHSVPGFDVSADGQRFVVPAVNAEKAPSIVVIQNWEALMTQAALRNR